jgi:hypothetical protein
MPAHHPAPILATVILRSCAAGYPSALVAPSITKVSLREEGSYRSMLLCSCQRSSGWHTSSGYSVWRIRSRTQGHHLDPNGSLPRCAFGRYELTLGEQVFVAQILVYFFRRWNEIPDAPTEWVDHDEKVTEPEMPQAASGGLGGEAGKRLDTTQDNE